jgi:protein-tyrosine kinase
MSKIYKALEKAERNRRKEEESKWDFPSSEPQEDPEEQKTQPELKMIEPEVHVPQLMASFQPGSLAAEQFRKLRGHLLRMKSPESPRAIMVTSATNGEGKSFVAANLAAGIATDLHTQALLVDCDLRNPSLSKWFDLPETKGLSDYLSGSGATCEYMFKTGLEKLSLLPAGTIQENPTELIGSKKMEAFIRELKSKQSNRYIIFDSTPVLATTEPEVLGRLVDGILFVVRAGLTPRETIQQAMRSLEKEKILGVVLNDLNFKSSALHSRYFGSDGYYYEYAYGRKRHEEKQKWWQRLFRKKKE